ncbi:MAG: tetratricopeptide repeat protein [Thermoplasmatota archaeon]
MPDVQELLAEGQRLMNEFDYEGAYDKFSKALKKEDVPEAYFGRAESAALGMPEKDSDDIVEDYEKAIEMDDNPFYHQAVAAFCIDVGKFDKAEEHYRRAAELDPDNEHNYLSELAVGYRFKAPVMMEKFLDQGGEEIILRKSLNYMLEAMDIDREKALELLK